jgi:hypothetical protein
MDVPGECDGIVTDFLFVKRDGEGECSRFCVDQNRSKRFLQPEKIEPFLVGSETNDVPRLVGFLGDEPDFSGSGLFGADRFAVGDGECDVHDSSMRKREPGCNRFLQASLLSLFFRVRAFCFSLRSEPVIQLNGCARIGGEQCVYGVQLKTTCEHQKRENPFGHCGEAEKLRSVPRSKADAMFPKQRKLPEMAVAKSAPEMERTTAPIKPLAMYMPTNPAISIMMRSVKTSSPTLLVMTALGCSDG